MFVVIGEALVDLVGQRGSRMLVAHPGGSPANVALGLGRLGNPVTLMTHLGRDAFGEMISTHLQASGVRVAGADAESKTSLAVATLAAGIATYDSASNGTSGTWSLSRSRPAACTRARWRPCWSRDGPGCRTCSSTSTSAAG